MVNITIDGTTYEDVENITVGGKTLKTAETGITPSGTLEITANGTGIDVTKYAKVNVTVSSSEERDGGLLKDSVMHDYFVNGSYSSLKAPMTKTTVSDGTYTIELDQDYAGTKTMANQRFGWRDLLVVSGNTYTFSCDSISGGYYLYGMTSVTESTFDSETVAYFDKTLITSDAQSGDTFTFTASADFIGLSLCPVTPVSDATFTIVNPKLVEVTA